MSLDHSKHNTANNKFIDWSWKGSAPQARPTAPRNKPFLDFMQIFKNILAKFYVSPPLVSTWRKILDPPLKMPWCFTSMNFGFISQYLGPHCSSSMWSRSWQVCFMPIHNKVTNSSSIVFNYFSKGTERLWFTVYINGINVNTKAIHHYEYDAVTVCSSYRVSLQIQKHGNAFVLQTRLHWSF